MTNTISIDLDKNIIIRNAAIRLFCRQGIHKTSIQQIADEAGIAKGTIYLYFKSKDDLINQIINYCFNNYLVASIECLEYQKNSSDKLKRYIRNMIYWADKFQYESKIISTFYKPVNIVGTKNVAFSKSFEISRKLIEDGVANGEFKKLPIEFLCTMLYSLIEGITKYVINNPHILRDEELVEKMLESIVSSIRQ